MNNPPNLFNYATSELSQDAAIMWLLEWAKPMYKESNFKLHQLGLSLLKSFYSLHNLSLSEFEDIKIKPQFKKIDILIEVIRGDLKTAILIEDKTKSSNHSNQLKQYLNFLNSTNQYDLVMDTSDQIAPGISVKLRHFNLNGKSISVRFAPVFSVQTAPLTLIRNSFRFVLRHFERSSTNYLVAKNIAIWQTHLILWT